LTDEDVDEIKGAVVYFKGEVSSLFVPPFVRLDRLVTRSLLTTLIKQGLDGSEVSRETCPLPELSKKLDAICQDVYKGKGFDVLRGLDPEA
jgi:hypothetical protein